MKWLVEEYDDHVKELVEEIKAQGHEVDFINYYKMRQDSSYSGVGLPKGCGDHADNECVLFYGSIQTAQWLNRHKQWIPTVWYNYDKYKVSHWSAVLGPWMLNDEGVFVPKGTIDMYGGELINRYGEDGNLFIRPDSGTKSFGGRVFHIDGSERKHHGAFYKEWANASHLMDNHEMCFIAKPWKISKEWRFICAGNEIISGSQYKVNGSAEIEAGYPDEAAEMCQHIIDDGYHPDPMYTVDIGLCGDVYSLIELNNFCCSGLYACDLKKIVAKASELAIAEHKDFYPLMNTLPGC